MRIAVIVGNPKPESFCRALGRAYQEAAEAAGHEARLIDVGRLRSIRSCAAGSPRNTSSRT